MLELWSRTDSLSALSGSSRTHVLIYRLTYRAKLDSRPSEGSPGGLSDESAKPGRPTRDEGQLTGVGHEVPRGQPSLPSGDPSCSWVKVLPRR